MIQLVRRMWQAAPVATAILGGALLFGLFFAVRLTAFWIYWADPAHRNQALEPWMTPGYVAHSWGIPREVMFDDLALPRYPGHPLSLAQIAEERGVPVETLIEEVRLFIEAARAERGQR